MPKKYELPTRNIHIEAMLTIMVKVASPAALSAFDRVKDSGQINRDVTAKQCNICSAIRTASGD